MQQNFLLPCIFITLAHTKIHYFGLNNLPTSLDAKRLSNHHTHEKKRYKNIRSIIVDLAVHGVWSGRK